MSQTTIYIGDDMVAEIDDRRHSTTSRSKWVRDAIVARLQAEDAGEWESPDDTAERGATADA